MQVHILDVGQGDAILIEAPGDKTVLIDAGTSKSNVLENLQQRGIKRLDLVIASHPHADHIGGMPAVLKGFEIGTYVDNGMTHTTMTYARTLQAVEGKEIQYQRGVNGRTFNVGPEVKLTILHPRSTLLRGTRSDLNSNSVVVRLDHKDICFLFTGDAEDPTERDLLNRGLNECEVLKVAHHGSKHSTSDSVLRAVKPRYAAISAGAGNRYGHPAPETLERLERAEVEVHRTDIEGTITFISSGRSISIRSQRKPSTESVAEASTTESHPTPIQHTVVASATVATGSPVNVNTADSTGLQSLHGIGPSKSAAIIADRTANGSFSSCSDLQRVHGIGPKTVENIQGRCVTESETGVADVEPEDDSLTNETTETEAQVEPTREPEELKQAPESDLRWWQLLKKLRSKQNNGESKEIASAA
jgi:competence protein ComEC